MTTESEQAASSAKTLRVEDLIKPGEDVLRKPVVEVDDVEQVDPVEQGREDLPVEKERSTHEDVRDHETEKVRTSYTVEEESPPSFMQKLKGRFVSAEDKLKSKDAKATDPHPELSLEPSGTKPGIISKIQQSIWGKKEGSSPAVNSSIDVNARPQEKAMSQPENVETFTRSSEMGTGYEESSEEGGTPSQSQELFKPANDVPDQASKDLQAASDKLNLDEGVKAPNMLERAKEEVDALSGQMQDKLGFEDKRQLSGGMKSQQGQPGLISRLAEKIGYGGKHNRTRSQ